MSKPIKVAVIYGSVVLRHTTVSFFAAPERPNGSATKTFKEWS